MMSSAGIDGCKAGWFVVVLNGRKWDTLILKNFSQFAKFINSTQILVVDIPIGLQTNERDGRACDIESRKILTNKLKSSIFPAPCRAALSATSYKEANKISINSIGKGLSVQSWNIMPKIKAVDDFLREYPQFIEIILESHPEIAFAFLADNKGMSNRKKTTAGLNERLDLLNKFEPDAIQIYHASVEKYLRKEVARDDIVDAICMAVIGKMIFKAGLKTIPEDPPEDSFGIKMRICLPQNLYLDSG